MAGGRQDVDEASALLLPAFDGVEVDMVDVASRSRSRHGLELLASARRVLEPSLIDSRPARGTFQVSLFFLELRQYGTFIPQVLSFWVLLLGYSVFKSGFLPRILGILLMLAGSCYTVDAILFLLVPDFDATMLGLFAFIGELLFYLWLLIKGVNVEEWEKRFLNLPDSGLRRVRSNLEENS